MIFVLVSLMLMIPVTAVFAQEKPKSGYFTTSDGVKIHYLMAGKGVPVILIHGYTGSAEGNWFSNGIALALAKNHMVVAIDCRNHGKSDKPQPMGPGKAEDVIEMMDHLKIQKAHFHGYSMGGGIVSRLLALIPDRFITAGFGGSGVQEVDPEIRAKVPADKEGPDPQEAEASARLRARRAQDLGMSVDDLNKQMEARQQQQRAALEAARTQAASRPAQASGPALDLKKITFPVMAVNGEFDRPNVKTHRLWRELPNFTNIVLPGKSHLTAIMAGYMPKEYLEAVVKFINSNDPK
jgi:pimeloyl-ACP methyl ester carboxylesterase